MRVKDDMELAKLLAQGNVTIVEGSDPRTRGEPPAAAAVRKSRITELEDMFDTLWEELGYSDIIWEKNYIGWCPDHPRWELDRAYPRAKVYVEIHGGVWLRKSGHNTGKGLTRDYSKQNMAVVLGWIPFVLTTDMLRGPEAAAWLVRINNEIRTNIQVENVTHGT